MTERERVIGLLSAGGEAREHFRATNGDWVDGFFDQVIQFLYPTPTQDDALMATGVEAVNLTRSSDGQCQLNIRLDKNRGWSVYVGETYAQALQKWHDERALVQRVKQDDTDGLQTRNHQQEQPQTYSP